MEIPFTNGTNKRYIYVHYLLLFILVYFIIFLKLGDFNIRWWDESMFAVNTYEMIHNGKWFSLYFNNLPDLCNTKPPMAVWLQILFVKTMGYNELAVRLPSAIAATLSIFFLFRFAARHFSYLWAWISSLILLTSYGFVHFHTARTADADSMLTFFLLAANLCFASFILNQTKSNILFFFIFIALALATKLFAALLFVPAYLFVLIYYRSFKTFVFNWYFLAGILLLLVSIGSLVYLREKDAPGYFNTVLHNDAGRLINVYENHNEPAHFYLDNLFYVRYSPWFIFFIAGSVLLFFYKGIRNQKNILWIFLSFIVGYLAIIMSSITKLEWYDMPIFPYLAFISAYPIFLLIQSIEWREKALSGNLKYSILILFFVFPYSRSFEKSQGNTIPGGEMKLEANEIFLYQKSKIKADMNNIKVYYSGWNGSLIFYKYKMAERRQNLILVNDLSQISNGDRVLVCNDSLKAVLSDKYDLTRIDSYHNAKLFSLKQKITSLQPQF
jgi:4-amino-4-deoxy-L-arabinose transferase-like glycosyltransferase